MGFSAQKNHISEREVKLVLGGSMSSSWHRKDRRDVWPSRKECRAMQFIDAGMFALSAFHALEGERALQLPSQAR